MPYFFQFATDKDKTTVCDINDSTVNRICKEIENADKSYKYDFSKVGTFSIPTLLSGKTKMTSINLNTKMAIGLIEKYEDVDKNKNMIFSTVKQRDKEQMVKDSVSIYKVCKEELDGYMKDNNINIVDGVDILIKYLYYIITQIIK